MTSREEMQIERSRHELGRLLGSVVLALEDAEKLLEPKAQRSPASAEADAYRRIKKARQHVLAWCGTAGPPVGIPVENGDGKAATPQSAGA